MLIDISMEIRLDMPHWPSSIAPACEWETRLDRGEEFNASRWTISAHQAVGIDYLSMECFGETGFPAHHVLLGVGIPLIEGLDLSAAQPGEYTLTCLPIRLASAEAAPARAVLTSCDQAPASQ
jgi:kynurenine formamidase